jgi:hypothetical protein
MTVVANQCNRREWIKTYLRVTEDIAEQELAMRLGEPAVFAMPNAFTSGYFHLNRARGWTLNEFRARHRRKVRMTIKSDLAKTVVKSLGKKETKAESGYKRGTKAEHCGICSHYAAHECEIVEGRIFPAMWCRYFEKRAK